MNAAHTARRGFTSPAFRGLVAAAAVLISVPSGCAGEAIDGQDLEGYEASEGGLPSWEEFLAAATHVEPDGTEHFFVDGDVPIEDEDALRDIYDSWSGTTPKSLVRTNGANGSGGDGVWVNNDQLDITYCVASSGWPTISGQNLYTLTQTYMADATRLWQEVVNVRYRYVPSQDASCAGGNTGVKINVVPGSASACASPPYTSLCQSGGRALAINYNAVPQTYAARLPIFLHELGHVIGLEHEHWAAPPDPTTGCQASTAFRRLEGTTTFDAVSIMAYACAGLTPGTVISFLDGRGARSLYGAPAAWHPAFFGMYQL